MRRSIRLGVLTATLLTPALAAAAPGDLDELPPPPGGPDKIAKSSPPAALAPGQSAPPSNPAPKRVAPAPPPSETAPAPTETAPVPTETAPAPVQTVPAAPPPGPAAPVQTVSAPAKPAVDDAAWDALKGRQVVVQTTSGTVEGELLESQGDTLVLAGADGQVQTLPKAQATGVRVAQAPTAAGPAPASEMAGLDPAPAADAEAGAEAGADAKDDEAAQDGEEELTPAEKRRKERREKRDHAILGAFAMQGATYTHWNDRKSGTYTVNAGHASYAMDWGLGVNFAKSFGLYAMAGGLLGAKIQNKSIKANSGHVDALFVFGGKWYFSTLGAGVAFSRLRFADGTLQKDKGLSIPTKFMAKIPLPKKLYIGIGLTYEFQAVRKFSRFVHGIGGQIVFGRW